MKTYLIEKIDGKIKWNITLFDENGKEENKLLYAQGTFDNVVTEIPKGYNKHKDSL